MSRRALLHFFGFLTLSLPHAGQCDVRFSRYDVQVTLDQPDAQKFQVLSKAHGRITAGAMAIRMNFEGESIQHVGIALNGVPIAVPAWKLSNGILRIGLPIPPSTNSDVTVATSTTARYAVPKGEGLVKYQGADGTIYSTQFQPAAARKVFPVIDRPNAPARFRFAILCPSRCNAFSNVASSAISGDGTEVQFHLGPDISPHLAAFVAGDLVSSNHIEVGTRNSRIAVASPKSHHQYASKVLALSREVIEAFEEQGLRLPTDKVDVVLIPEFRYFGMENPGILFLRAGLVSWAASSDRWNDLKELIAHEFAHQWFGNLLAPSQWRDVWISESFATWATERIVPTAGNPLADLVDQIRGLGLPVASNYPQVEDSPSSIFSSSRYGRGAGMLRAVFGPDVKLGAVLEGLLGSDQRVYLTTDELLTRFDRSKLSQVEIPTLRRALYSVRPIALEKRSPDLGENHIRYDSQVCDGLNVHKMDNLGVWTYQDAGSYRRVMPCLEALSEEDRLTLDVSVFAAAWRRTLSVSDALTFVEAESAGSAASAGDVVRSRILERLLQAVPAEARADARRRALDRISAGRGSDVGKPLIEVLSASRLPEPLSLKAMQESIVGRLGGERITTDRLAGAEPDAVRWIVSHPNTWPLGKDEAYQFMSVVVQRDDSPLQGVSLDEFEAFLELHVAPDRYDNVASKFAYACDSYSLEILRGAAIFQSAESIEQRDAGIDALISCISVKSGVASTKNASRPRLGN